MSCFGEADKFAAIAEFGMLLRESPYSSESSFDEVLEGEIKRRSPHL
ncbi:MAG: hypothetical protein WBB82_11755 [Limnothrix sp.]